VFDLDGTLLALSDARAAGLTRVCALVPGVRDPADLARRLWIATETPLNYGMLLLGRSGLEPGLRPLLERARRFKGVAPASDLRAIEGVAPTLRALAKRYRLAVLTSRGRREAIEFLERTGLMPLFASVTTRHDLWRLKPHPSALRTALAPLGCGSDRALVVGDMPADVRVAARAGAIGVGVTSGFSTRAELEAAGARLVVADVNELGRILLGSGPPLV
jgi:HAD superfamily hydrolase (TIGR01509 family)